MTYKLYILITLLVGFVSSSYGQSISITAFKDMPDDITAVSHGTTVIDQNGEKCALIKVETTQTGFSFDVGTLGVVKTAYKPGEVWVYVPYGVKRISISHPSFGILRDYNFPHALEKGKTYLINLNTSKTDNLPSVRKSQLIKENISKTELFCLGDNEEIYRYEQYMDLSMDKGQFACVVQDTITKEKTFIWNGIRKFSAKGMYIAQIDLQCFENCVGIYFNDDEQYIYLNGKQYGPYEYIYYVADPPRWDADYKGRFMNGIDKPYRMGWPFHNTFIFQQMGNYFIFDNGKIDKVDSEYIAWDNGKINGFKNKLISDLKERGISPNRKYKLTIKDNTLKGGAVNFTLPFVPASKEVFTYDNGNAIIIIDNGADDWRNRERKYYQVSLVTGKVRELGENECFDYKNGTIINEPQKWDRQFERRDPDFDAEYLAIFMQDPSLEHTLISKLKYPYVLVDNQKIGNSCAIDAYFDSSTKSFCWFALENNRIVLYEYKL